jgi:hypothetical protein
MENRISIEIPAKVTAEVLAKFREIETLLKPYTMMVPEEEKNSLLKLGDKTLPFVNKTVGYMDTASEYSPSYLDTAEFKRDNRALQALDQMYQPAVQVLKMIEDTRALAGNDAYSAALVYYNAIKQASLNGITKAKVIYEDLSQRFPGRPRKAAETVKG